MPSPADYSKPSLASVASSKIKYKVGRRIAAILCRFIFKVSLHARVGG